MVDLHIAVATFCYYCPYLLIILPSCYCARAALNGMIKH